MQVCWELCQSDRKDADLLRQYLSLSWKLVKERVDIVERLLPCEMTIFFFLLQIFTCIRLSVAIQTLHFVEVLENILENEVKGLSPFLNFLKV